MSGQWLFFFLTPCRYTYVMDSMTLKILQVYTDLERNFSRCTLIFFVSDNIAWIYNFCWVILLKYLYIFFQKVSKRAIKMLFEKITKKYNETYVANCKVHQFATRMFKKYLYFLALRKQNLKIIADLTNINNFFISKYRLSLLYLPSISTNRTKCQNGNSTWISFHCIPQQL